MDVESWGIVELNGVLRILVELTPIADETKDVGGVVELAGGAEKDTETTDTEMPLGVEIDIVVEH